MTLSIKPMRTYAVGDVHGMADALTRALGWIKEDAAGVPHRIVFLGDYVDRGPESRRVIDILRMGHPNWIILKGNHEDLMARAVVYKEDVDLWIVNGGSETLANYDNTEDSQAALLDDAKWVDSLPLFFDDGVRFFCHAGVDPTRALNEQHERTLVWDREWYRNRLGKDIDVGRFVVHGHTPSKIGPVAVTNSLNLDTGAVFGYGLSIACWDDPRSRMCLTKTFQTEHGG